MSHAPLPPSSAHIFGPDGCAGAMQMQATQPPQEPTEESREGDAAHWLLAQTLLKLTVPADAIAPNGIPIIDEMHGAIQELVTDVNDTLATCQPGDHYEIEQTIAAPSLLHPQCWGTPDVLFVQHSARTIHIWDFKYGHRFVDAYRNWQMIAYAACAVDSNDISDWRDWSFTLTIAQPRCFERDELGGTMREWFVPGSELAPLIEQLSAACHEAMRPGAICRTGGHCRDCLAQWDCAANQRQAGGLLDLIHRQGSAGMDPAAIGLEARTLDIAMDRIKARLAALDAKAMSLMNSGQRVPYHQIGWTNPRTVWDKSLQHEAAQMVGMFGVPVLPGVDIPTPAQCIKQGVDEAVISPYVTSNKPAQKLIRVDDAAAPKILGRR